MYRFFKIKITDKNMSKVMYAILRTKSKLVNSVSIDIHNYTRRHSKGFSVDIVIDIDEKEINLFEELAEVKLQTSEEFKGKIQINQNN